jgi:hypothetical protein
VVHPPQISHTVTETSQIPGLVAVAIDNVGLAVSASAIVAPGQSVVVNISVISFRTLSENGVKYSYRIFKSVRVFGDTRNAAH